MRTPRPSRVGRGERGAVLPLVMLSLLVLSAVLIALSALSGQEPLIATNHLVAVQAQALAEAGLERALWALGSPEATDGVPWNAPAPAPYDGSQLIRVTNGGALVGGFRLTIDGMGDRQRQILAIGLVPGDDGPLGRAKQEISATAIRLRFPTPPASLTVRGDLRIGDGVTVDASGDGSCGDVAGTWSSGATTVGAGSRVLGRSANPAIPPDAAGVSELQPTTAFEDRAFTTAELAALKALARARGTYYRGVVTFDSSRPMPEGLIFVDTVSGQPVNGALPDGELASVTIADGAAASRGGSSRGWLVVNGSVSLTGEVTIAGLVYAADRFTQTGSARLVGAAMAGHARATEPSLVDSRPVDGAALVWSCEAGRTGSNTVPQRWLVKPGSYREAAG